MRILAGKFRGRVLLPPPSKAQTRPITGRAKKSLFDTLGPYLDNAGVLDLYSGTGTMGLEAISRGAAWCIFAERDRSVVSRLRRNIEACQAGDLCDVWCGDIRTRLRPCLSALERKIDIAFVDPPYADARRWDWSKAEANIFRPLEAKLADDGLLVLRTPKGLEVPNAIAGLTEMKTKKYGSMIITLMARPDDEPAKTE
jgi:16S rRNA (guanine966-N2)-methyltransferase